MVGAKRRYVSPATGRRRLSDSPAGDTLLLSSARRSPNASAPGGNPSGTAPSRVVEPHGHGQLVVFAGDRPTQAGTPAGTVTHSFPSLDTKIAGGTNSSDLLM